MSLGDAALFTAGTAGPADRLHPHTVSWRPRPARRCPPVCGPSRSVLSPAHVPSRTAARSLRPPMARWFPPCLGLGDPPWCVDPPVLPRLASVHGELGRSQIPAVVNTGAPASLPGPSHYIVNAVCGPIHTLYPQQQHKERVPHVHVSNTHIPSVYTRTRTSNLCIYLSSWMLEGGSGCLGKGYVGFLC